MVNRILFRAERIDGGGLVYGLPVYLTEYAKDFDEIDGIQCNKTRENYEIIPESLGQLSNMLSRRAGVDIFVGDEIKFNLLEMVEDEPEVLGLSQRVNTIEDNFTWYDKVKLKL